MQKNSIIFLIITFIFIFLYFQIILPKLVPQQQPQNIKETNVEKTNQISKKKINNENINTSPSKEQQTKEILVGDQNIPTITKTFKNKDITLIISSDGGYFKEVILNKYKKDTKENANLVINDPEKKFKQFQTGFINLKTFQLIKPLKFKFIPEKSNAKTIVFETIVVDKNNKKVKIEKIFEFTDGYEINLKFIVKGLENNIPDFGNDITISLINWGYLLGPADVLKSKYNRQIFQIYMSNKFYKKSVRTNRIDNYETFDWFAISNLYFTSIIKKDDINKYELNITGYKKYEIELSLIPEKFELIKNTFKFKIYYAPKDRKILGSYDPTFKNIANYGGLLSPIVLLFNALLKFLFSFMKNWGIAIIALSLIIKVALYPFTHSSMISMRKMSQLSPKIKEIQEKYKNDPQRAHLEISNLYKKEKVNPLSGCLPILLQMPFLIALFNALLYNIDLRNAGFLWIKDLSSPDVLIQLKFSIPLLGNAIRLLPIIMLITSIIQSALQSQGQVATSDSSGFNSKLMTYMLPIVFFFIFYNMPSGLVLYWTTMNIFTLIETFYINKVELAKKGISN